MNWIDSLERRFGHLAIHGLIRIVVGFNAAVFVLFMANPNILSFLVLDPNAIRHGQLWRLVTFIFIPSIGRSALMPDYLWLVFALLFLWMLGDGLEQAWGAFKLNLFYLAGMIGTTIAAFIFGASSNNVMLNLSLLFAFATIYPDHQILILLVIPVKMIWVAWFSFALLMLTFFSGSWSTRAAIFGMAKQRKVVADRRLRFERDIAEVTADALHCCVVCKKTEVTNPEAEFRVSKDGNEYCAEHLPAKV